MKTLSLQEEAATGGDKAILLLNTLIQGFSTSALLPFQARSFFVVEAVLYSV